ncbi:MAG: hypothetical protein JW863_12900 [Chitinispirillaceae bacterium]|nr:hypothetical protein [Chitinispirillaceae bacterium]
MISRSLSAAFTSAAGVLFCSTIISIAPLIHADPSLACSSTVNQDLLCVSITGSELPELLSITVNCTYDPERVVLMDAIISSPLPSTAFSALIDTAATSLAVSVNATGTLQITDGSTIVALKIPLAASEEGDNAFTLSSAAFTDVSGETHAVPVGSTAVAAPPLYRAGTTPAKQTRNAFSGVLLLNGKRGNRTSARSAPGYIIRSAPDGTMLRGNVVIK